MHPRHTIYVAGPSTGFPEPIEISEKQFRDFVKEYRRQAEEHSLRIKEEYSENESMVKTEVSIFDGDMTIYLIRKFYVE